jgi:polar amino acid transport system permease protein
MNWDWNFAFDVLPDLLYAFARFTLVATVLGTLLAAVLGLAFAIIRRARVPVLAPVTTAFIEFVRSTPLLVQLFFLYFVLPDFGITLPALTTGVIALGVHYACYLAEVYRAGIEGVPKGQWEACTALDLPPRLQWQHVILPQAIRNVLPALGNYAISMFKETPFLALITVPEMVQRSQAIGSISFRYLEPITLAGRLD